MAVTKTPIGSTIRLSLITGLDAQGGPILRTTSLSNVKSAAADQDVFDTASALLSLQEYQLNSISRVDSAELSQV